MVGGSTISKLISIVAGTYLLGAYAMAADGLTTIASDYGPKETMDRLEAEIKAKGMTVFARIDHAAGAAQAGLSLRSTKVLLFGNAKAGTPLMQSNQTIGIDLPLKALVWQESRFDPRKIGSAGRMPTARCGSPTMSRTGLRRVTGWRPQPSRRSTPWRAASARSQGAPPASSDAWLLGCQVHWKIGL